VSRQLSWLVLIVTLLILSYKLGTRHYVGTSSRVVSPKAMPARTGTSGNEENRGQVKVVGPLANWMREAEENQGLNDDSNPESAPIPTYQPSPRDRVVRTPTSAPDNFVHSTFPVSRYAVFEIQIPPGTTAASLSGSFASFTKKVGQERRAANVELLLFNESEFHEFGHGNLGSATYSTEPSPTKAVKWVLDSDYKQVKKYYLVFSNPGSRTEFVRANFTVQFN
jgi:hypothetical protein